MIGTEKGLNWVAFGSAIGVVALISVLYTLAIVRVAQARRDDFLLGALSAGALVIALATPTTGIALTLGWMAALMAMLFTLAGAAPLLLGAAFVHRQAINQIQAALNALIAEAKGRRDDKTAGTREQRP